MKTGLNESGRRWAIVTMALFVGAVFLVSPTLSWATEEGTLLISRNQLHRMLIQNQPVRIIDARAPEFYARGHLPGSVNYSARATLRNDRGMFPSLRVLTANISRLGLTPGVPIVIYDQSGYREAARLFWIFESLGWAGQVSILEGGITQWILEGRDVDTDVPEITSVPVLLTIDDTRLVTRRAVQVAANEQTSTALIDTRELLPAGKALEMELFSGAIPGAVSLPWSWVFQGGRQLKTTSELQYLNQILPGQSLILYCRNGYDSLLVYFAFRRAGRDVAVYFGGLDEWLSDKQLPVNYEPLDNVIK